MVEFYDGLTQETYCEKQDKCIKHPFCCDTGCLGFEFNNKKKIYYAHCRALYGTQQENRDILLLESLGFDVLNPNNKVHQDSCKAFIDVMEYFLQLVATCDAVAFRALPNGKIPAGVLKEVKFAYEKNKPVMELPVNIGLREMTVEQTRAYLTEVGQR